MPKLPKITDLRALVRTFERNPFGSRVFLLSLFGLALVIWSLRH